MIDYDNFCKKCRHYEFDLYKGILCGITHKKPAFEGNCGNFALDPKKEKELSNESRLKTYSTATAEEGMTPGEWIGAFLCTPYGLIKYFDWKDQYPLKSKQVCILYLILLAINVLLTFARIATETSGY
ncbi:MAG: hypothetical protein GF353_24965 [Candidatus Lokiarchaeota archaeon]|nr:hypothetical protein [Candidatus Lokiarchaeota archaeon]